MLRALLRPGRLAELGVALTVMAVGAAPALALPVTQFNAPGGPVSITTGPDGNLWYTQRSGGVARMTLSGAVTEFVSGITAGSGPGAITSGPDGNLWFSEHEGNAIGRITPKGIVTEFKLGGWRYDGPNGITVGPDGNLWATRSSSIIRVTPAGSITEYTTGITPGRRAPTADPAEITTGPDGNLWFGEANADRVGRITPAGEVTEFQLGTGESVAPGGIAVGADGNLWIAEYFTSSVSRVTTAGVITRFSEGITQHSGPGDLIAGPDRNVWFTEQGGLLGRMTTDGVVAEFDIGLRPKGGMPEITVGPDGNLWVTDPESDRILRVSLTEPKNAPQNAPKGPTSNAGDPQPAPPRNATIAIRGRVIKATATGRAGVKLACSAACTGQVTIRRSGKTLGRAAFKDKSGKFTVRIRLSARTRRSLHRAHRHRLKASVKVTANGLRATRTMEVRR